VAQALECAFTDNGAVEKTFNLTSSQSTIVFFVRLTYLPTLLLVVMVVLIQFFSMVCPLQSFKSIY